MGGVLVGVGVLVGGVVGVLVDGVLVGGGVDGVLVGGGVGGVLVVFD